MVKNTTSMAQFVKQQYVAPTIEIDVYNVEKGYATSQAWDQEEVSLLTDDDGNIDDEGSGWFNDGGVVF